MLDKLLRSLRQSFSAKIIALVITSVIVTSVVVGFVTTRSTKLFLVEKTSEKFPSIIAANKSKVSLWYDHQIRDLERLCQAQVFLDNLERHLVTPDSLPPDSAALSELSKYVSIVHERFPVFEELLVLDVEGNMVTSTSQSPGDAVAEVWSIIKEGG